MKYYRIITKMIFEKEVLVPCDDVKDVDDAIHIVDDAVESCEIFLFDEEAEHFTGLVETEDINDSDVNYQVVRKDV